MKIIRSGRWTYDDAVARPVDIISLGFDWWFELAKADGSLEPDEKPVELSTDGVLYYVRFRHAGDSTEPTWPDSPGYRTVDAAIAAAQVRAPTQIIWSDESP